jgi:tight adherence protein B
VTTQAALAAALAACAVLFAGTAAVGTRRDAILIRAGVRPRTQPMRGSMPRPPSWVWTIAGSLAASLVGVRVAGLVGAVVASGGVVALPAILRRRRRAAASRLTQDQLAEGISVIAAGLRAGRSLRQAFELAAAEVDPPIGPSFERVTGRVELGDPMDDAIGAWAREISGADARLAAGVLRLHRRTGGALAATLERLATTLRDRRSAARELRSLTAQARLSANILGLLPLGFFGFLSLVAREDIVAAVTAPAGATAIALGLVLQAAAYVWIRRLLRLEP